MENTFKDTKNTSVPSSTRDAGEEYITGLHWNKEIIQNSIHRKNYSMLTIYLSNLIKGYNKS